MWHDVTLAMLEDARRRMRELVKLVERAKRAIVGTDFEDELGQITERPDDGDGDSHVNVDRFRAKVRVFLWRHADNIVLRKLRRNRALTASDLAELDRVLAGSGELDQKALRDAIEQAAGLGLLIRSLVGLDRSAAVEALAAFLEDKTLSASQIEFVDLVVEHLTRDGAMTMAALYEPPFVEIAPSGPDVIFPAHRLTDLELALDDIRARASVA